MKKVKAMKINQNENEVKKAIASWLSYMSYDVYRINNGGVYRGKNKQGKTIYSFAGTKGVADVFAILPLRHTLWIETKSTGRKQTIEQKQFETKVMSVPNNYYICADSLEKFIKERNKIDHDSGDKVTVLCCKETLTMNPVK